MTDRPEEIVSVYDDVSGDWEGLYFDGRLVTQNHSIDAGEVLSLIGYDVTYVSASAEETGGRFPDRLEDVVTTKELRRRSLLAEAAELRAKADSLEASIEH
jgi:hypothetical protein